MKSTIQTRDTRSVRVFLIGVELKSRSAADIVESLGSQDGREVACALDELRQSGKLGRDRDGRYHLQTATPGVTGIVGELYHDPNDGA